VEASKTLLLRAHTNLEFVHQAMAATLAERNSWLALVVLSAMYVLGLKRVEDSLKYQGHGNK
jgi:hypothetical protein